MELFQKRSICQSENQFVSGVENLVYFLEFSVEKSQLLIFVHTKVMYFHIRRGVKS